MATVPVPDSEPPPYDVVVRLPPSYISREPPPYCEIDIDKYPSPLICPRVPSHIRLTSSSATIESPEASDAPASQEATSCDSQASEARAEAPAPAREEASAGAGEASAVAAVPPCVAEVTVVSEVGESPSTTSGDGEAVAR